MKLNKKILFFFFFFLFIFNIDNLAFEGNFLDTTIISNLSTFSDFENFEVNNFYLSNDNGYVTCYIPFYIDKTNKNAVIFYYTGSYVSSDGSFNFSLNSGNYLYFINNSRYIPSFSMNFRDSVNNLNYSHKRSFTFFDDNYIYMFSSCDWSNDYLVYTGGLYKNNNVLDFVLGDSRISFKRYNLSNGTIDTIFQGSTGVQNFSFNSFFSQYDLNDYSIIPLFDYLCTMRNQLGLSSVLNISYNRNTRLFSINTNMDFEFYNSNGLIPISFITDDIIFPLLDLSFVTKNVSFVFDDYNLMKRFKYNVDLPLYSEYSKYFAFLKSVDRVNANLVNLTLDIYIIDLPEELITDNGYSTGYENLFNFLMYDNKESCFFFPYGMRLKHIVANGSNNSTMSTTLDFDTITTRYDFNNDFFNSFMKDSILTGSNTYIFKTTDLLASNYISSLFLRSVSFVPSINVPLKSGIFNWSLFENNYESNFADFLINYLYYSTTYLNYSMSDLLFSNYNVTSFEHTFKDFSSIVTWYEIFNHTTLYSQQNKLSDESYYTGFYDNKDLSTLPNISNTYNFVNNLYYNTDNSVSGGSIIYNTDDLSNRNNDNYNYDDSINYNDSNNLYNLPYIIGLIKDLQDNNSDNSIIDNNYSDKINSLKDYSTPLRAIYLMLENIDSDILALPNRFKVNVNSKSKDLNDIINKLLTTDNITLEDTIDAIDIALKTCLGAVSEPYYLVTYINQRVQSFSSDEMYVDLPQLIIMNYTILNPTRLDFKTFFESDTNLSYALNITRLFGDFVLTGLLFMFIKSTYKEVMKDDN